MPTDWTGAADGVLTDLVRFASYRAIGFTPSRSRRACRSRCSAPSTTRR